MCVYVRTAILVGFSREQSIVYVQDVYSRMTLVSRPMMAEEGSRTGKRATVNFNIGRMAAWSIL